MNIFLWGLQLFLAIHTAIGAVWKFSHTAEHTMPSLGAISIEVWLALAVVELVCVFALLLPAIRRKLQKVAALGALVIASEMLVFCYLHLRAGSGETAPIVYWLVVAAICGFIAFGRFQKPL